MLVSAGADKAWLAKQPAPENSGEGPACVFDLDRFRRSSWRAPTLASDIALDQQQPCHHRLLQRVGARQL